MPAQSPSVREVGDGRILLDLGFRDSEGLIASYLVPAEEGWTLVETGPGSCRLRLLDGIRQAGVDRQEILRVFVTHIHLDHSGGLGALEESFPRAHFYAHREGVAHLVDPAKLIASARRTWGVAADPLWGPIIPVHPSRLTALNGGEQFPVREGTLHVLDTPGHAKHHLAFFDSRPRALFTGDGAGVRLEGSGRARPAVPPPDLDLEKLFSSLEAMKRLEPRLLLYSHFGPLAGGARELDEYRTAVTEWRDVALAAAREEASIPHVARALREFEERVTAERQLPAPGVEQAVLVSSFEVAAMGLLRYFQQREPPTGSG